MKKKIIFDNIDTWNDEDIYNFLIQDFYKACIKGDSILHPGFCSFLYWNYKIFGDDSDKIVDFIKKYGKWNSECYFDCFGIQTYKSNQFIYPVYDWDSRIKLLKAAIKNYTNENK